MNFDSIKFSCVCVVAILELTTSTGFAKPFTSADVDFPEINPPQIVLGQLLFFDSILLRQQIGLMCDFHNLRFNTVDGLSFGIGDRASAMKIVSWLGL